MFGVKPTKRDEGRDFYWNAQKQTPADQRAAASRKKTMGAQ
jgi:hypothetical protein